MKRLFWVLILAGLVGGCGKGGCGASRPVPVVSETAPLPVEPELGPGRPAPISSENPFTFAVVGDNRGDSHGKAASAFLEIVAAMKAAAPDLVFNTGDMINAYAGEDEAHLRMLWKGYQGGHRRPEGACVSCTRQPRHF